MRLLHPITIMTIANNDSITYGTSSRKQIIAHAWVEVIKHFDDLYLMSDCVSLQYKGCNIGEFIFPNWSKIVPVNSLTEIARQINKTTERNKV